MQGDLFGRALPIAAMFERFPDCENAQQHTRHGAAQAQAADRVG